MLIRVSVLVYLCTYLFAHLILLSYLLTWLLAYFIGLILPCVRVNSLSSNSSMWDSGKVEVAECHNQPSSAANGSNTKTPVEILTPCTWYVKALPKHVTVLKPGAILSDLVRWWSFKSTIHLEFKRVFRWSSLLWNDPSFIYFVAVPAAQYVYYTGFPPLPPPPHPGEPINTQNAGYRK